MKFISFASSIFRVVFFLSPFALLTGCATSLQNPNLPNLVPQSQYEATVKKYTKKTQVYDGLTQIMEFTGVLLNSKVAREQADQSARIFQMDETQYSNKKSEVESGLAKNTQVFVSFYSPDRKYDDLARASTIWRVFLDAGGKRYTGKVEKMKTVFADVASLYPGHTRFHSPYRVTFPVATSMVENGLSKLTLTGPAGSAFVEFKAVE
jgi:hypothetical protein